MTNGHGRSKALIIGGGIAGMVSAIALKKAGFDATLFEARPTAADGIGAFLTLAVNGLDALRALDLDATSWGGFPTPRMVLRLGNGKQLTEFQRGLVSSGGAVTQTIRRADLYEKLREAVADRGVTMLHGKRLERARLLPTNRVVAHFDDGTEAEGDFLVGADGLHSRVRTLIDPDAPPARYVGLLNTGGYSRGVAVPGEVGTMQMIFGKRCFFCYIPHPSGEVWWFANPGRRKEPSRTELATITDQEWRAELIEALSRDATPAAELVRATDHVLSAWGTYDMPTVPVWHRDRMIVIGDAAHAASPSSGQGASMAIEDAIVLAKCVRDLPTVDAAYSTYEALRRERVEWIVARGKRNGDGKTPGLLGRVVRDLALQVVFSRKKPDDDETMAKIFDYRLTWDSPEVALCWG